MKVEFEGAEYEMPDDFSPQEVTKAVQILPKPRTLMSLEGLGSTLRLVGPSLARGILGSQLAGLEEVHEARKVKEAREERYAPLTAPPPEEDLGPLIEEKRKAIKEADVEIAKIRGLPSKPLDIAQQVVQSVAGNLPGVAAAVTARAAGPVAAVPALQAAGEQTFGQEYATAREKGAEVSAARRHASIAEVAEIGFEAMPTTWLIKNLGKMGAVEFVAKYIGRELATELPTTATQKISERINVEPDKPLGEFIKELGQELVDTALVVPFSAGITSVIGQATYKAGQPSEPAAPSGTRPPPEVAPAPEQGAVNVPLSAPSFDQPTTIPDSATKAQLDAIIDSIDETTLDEKTVEADKAVTATVDKQRELAKQAVHAPSWLPLATVPTVTGEDIGDLGASPKQAAKAPGYINPNVGERVNRNVLWSSIGQEDVPLAAIPNQPGTFVIGQETADRPEEYLTALGETYEGWRTKYMPNATLVIANEQLPSSVALGWHSSAGPNFSFIVPGVLRSVKTMEEFNTNARATLFFTASHEFGHALIDSRFFEGATPQVAVAAQRESEKGLVSEGVIAQLPPLQQAVVQEYNQHKARIMDGSMTAQEFVNTWLSPGKLARQGKARTPGANWLKSLGVAPSAPALQIGQALARQVVRGKIVEGADLKIKQQAERFFSLGEYLAEQTARAAYRNKWDVGSPLDRFLKNIVETLRKLFVDLKQDGIIKPGVAFQEWLDSLTAVGKGGPSDQTATAMQMRGPKAAKKAVGKKVKKAVAAPKVPRVQHNAVTDTSQEDKNKMLRMLTTLELSGVIPEAEARAMYDLIEKNDFDAFIDQFQKYAVKNVKFELDPEDEKNLDFTRSWTSNSVLRSGLPIQEAQRPEVLAEAVTEWRQKGFGSRFFKAWFGDWENDPQNASKVRRGAIIKHPVATRQVTLPTAGGFGQTAFAGTPFSPYGGEPLVVYHGTKANFLAFERGDIGFHFGTVRAANNRMGYGELVTPLTEGDEDTWIIPAVLNLRNPLYIGSERESNHNFWISPIRTLVWLRDNGIISPEAYARYEYETNESSYLIQQATTPLYQGFEPVRRVLIEAGYDGIVYDNEVEGDTSFVAFAPNQVKAILGARVFSRSNQINFELDYDAATPEGDGASKMFKGQKPYLKDPGPLRRALRRVTRKAAGALLQLQQMAHLNPNDDELAYTWGANREFSTSRSGLMAPAERASNQWADLGKENEARMVKFLAAERDGGELWFDLSKASGEWQYIMSARAEEKLREFGTDISTPEGAELAKIILDVKNALLHQLNGLGRVLAIALQNRYLGAGPEAAIAAVRPLLYQIHQYRKQPFFPQGLFGNYMITIEKKKERGPGYEVWYRGAFESESDWIAKDKELRAKAGPDEKVRMHKLTDREYTLLAIPKDFVNLAASELDLKPEQVEALEALLQPVKTEKAFTKYDEARLGLKGASPDAFRSFANFTWHNANAIAKMEFRHKFNQAISSLKEKRRVAEYSGLADQVQHYDFLQKYVENIRDYVMDPPYEAHALRATVSVGYLALNAKTASVNPFSLITTFADLTTRFGPVEGSAMMARGVYDALRSLQLTDLNARRAGDYFLPERMAALDKAIEEGVVTQSYAYLLAGAANEKNLERLFGAPRKHTARKYTQNAVDGAMWMFRLTELTSRRAAFLAQFEAGQKDEAAGRLTIGDSPYSSAVKYTNLQQGDYSPGNRPAILRGFRIKSTHPLARAAEPVIPLFTVFMMFLNTMAFHAYGGYELGQRRMAEKLGQPPSGPAGGYTAKLLAMIALMAGYEGLPGAEDLLNLVEFVWRKLGFPTPLRQEIRKLVQSVDGDPQLFARGLGHNVAGFDVSRSLGLGRLVPGMETLNRRSDSPEEIVGTLSLDMAGPAGSFIKFGLELMNPRKPMNESLMKMPGGLGNMWVAYQWSEHGVRGPMGGLVTRDLETGKLRDLTTVEVYGKALGFNPTIVSQNKEIAWQQHDQKMFWQSNRKRLLDDNNRALDQKDREAAADVRKAMSEYNAKVPKEYGSLRITAGDVANSRQAHLRGKRLEEQGLPAQRRYRPLYRDIKESYESP